MKAIRIMRWITVCIALLLSILLFRALPYSFRAATDDLSATRPLPWNIGNYSRLMVDDSGLIYSESDEHLLQIRPDGTFRLFHLEKFSPYNVGIEDGEIQIYSRLVVYRYDAQGRYLGQAPEDDATRVPDRSYVDAAGSYTTRVAANGVLTEIQNADGQTVFRTVRPEALRWVYYGAAALMVALSIAQWVVSRKKKGKYQR